MKRAEWKSRLAFTAILCCISLIIFTSAAAPESAAPAPATSEISTGSSTQTLAAGAVAATAQKSAVPKNVIIMISDGCGINTILATDLYTTGKTGTAVYESFPVKTMVSTYSSEGKGYDSAANWKEFTSPKSNSTDSAAAATAMATGVKTYNGAICVSPDKKPIKNILERAEDLGKSTGVVTTVPLSHATPAGFLAHNEDRDNYAQIALEMFEKSSADVIMGGGNPLYDDDGKRLTDEQIKDASAEDFNYVGGKDEWEKLVTGRAGSEVDADHNGKADDKWTLIQSRQEFMALVTGSAPKRVVGIAQVASTLQEGRAGHDSNKKDDMPNETPQLTTVPTLAEMTAGALNVLDDNKNGFCIMIEGGAIDFASHSNFEGRMIEEEMGFNDAVQAVVDWVAKNSSWDETLLIVTADHETGYVTADIASSGSDLRAFDAIPVTAKGEMPRVKYNSGSHTNNLVPLFAKGAGAQGLLNYPNGKDLHYGTYIDNTAIAKTVFEAWKWQGE